MKNDSYKAITYVTSRLVKPALNSLAILLGGLQSTIAIVDAQSSSFANPTQKTVEPQSYTQGSLLNLASISQSRAASLTGHISIMMGATVFIASRPHGNPILAFLASIDLLMYVFCMIICLYGCSSISLNSDFENSDEGLKRSHEDLALRFWSLQLANGVLVVASVLFSAISIYVFIEASSFEEVRQTESAQGATKL